MLLELKEHKRIEINIFQNIFQAVQFLQPILELAFTHRPYAYNGINSHTARNKSSVSHIQTIRWKYVLADTYFHLM